MKAVSAEGLRSVPAPSRAAIRAAEEAGTSVTIGVGGRALCVRFGDASWAQQFSQRYADHLTDAAPDVVHYVVQAGDGYSFWTPGDRSWEWARYALPADAIAFLADATAISALIHASPGLVSFHAAALEHRGSALAIAGDSTAGKTTTALSCARRGMRLFSDERCLVSGRIVVPFARSLNVRAPALDMLRAVEVDGDALLPGALDAAQPETPLPISRLFGRGAIASPAPLRAVVLLAGKDREPRLEPVSWHAAIPVLGRWMDGSERGLDKGARLIALMRGIACYRCMLGAPDATARLLHELLESVRPEAAAS